MHRFLFSARFLLVVSSSLLAVTSISPPAPVPQTGQAVVYGTFDDGYLNMGVPWPVPRFSDAGNGTVRDNLTGLTWLKNGGCFGEKDWAASLNDANTLASGACGLSDGSQVGDWRLPNVREMHSLINFGRNNPALPEGHPFTNVHAANYWTSTTHNETLTNHAWFVDLYSGEVYHETKSYTEWAWPVRGQTAGPASVPRTGQELCYTAAGDTIDCAGTGQDGEYRSGTSWPNPRFHNNGDGTVTDYLTGLTWLRNANCLGGIRWMYALEDIGYLASGTCGLSDGSQAGDWRIANVRELYSLIDFGRSAPALPGGHPFINVSSSTYWWTSTTDPRYAGDSARVVSIASGRISTVEKLYSQLIWPVRGETMRRVYLPLSLR